MLSPGSKVVGPHDNAMGLPPIEQPCFAGSTNQLMPELFGPVGSGSFNDTPVAVPGPALLTVIVKPMSSPALTTGLSAVFVSVSVGQLTSVVADDCCESALDA